MKRKTKIQREAEQHAALLQRVTDIYSGAQGQSWHNDDDNFASADILSKVVPVIEQIFGPQSEFVWFWSASVIHYFDRPSTATDFLFKEGFRA